MLFIQPRYQRFWERWLQAQQVLLHRFNSMSLLADLMRQHFYTSGMNAATSLPLLPPDLVTMMDKGVSVIVSSCSLAMRPSIMRAMGSAIEDGGRIITVYLLRQQSRQLIQDIAATGRIAVVFAEPATHRAVQVKSSSAHLRPAKAADQAVLDRYLKSMENEISQIGHNPMFTQALLAHELDDLVAITFEPSHAFDQTPGPKAGASLDLPSASHLQALP